MTITNDGATILKEMQVLHPVAKMVSVTIASDCIISHTCTQLVELSKAQDIEAGDGTTSVVVMAGSLLSNSQKLLNMGIHPTTISESYQRAAEKAIDVLNSMAIPVSLSDRESLLKSATTALNSKVLTRLSLLY